MPNVAWSEDPAVRILQYGATTIDERWLYPLHDPFWRLYLNESEGAWIDDRSRRQAVRPGRIHLIPAWSGLRSSCRGAVRHRYIHVDLGDWGRGSKPLSLPWAGLDGFRRLCDLPAWTARDRLEAGSMILAILAAAVASGALAVAPPVDDPIERTRRHLLDHLAETVPGRALAQVAGLSEGHLRVRFTAALGCSPGKWQRERRIAAATQLLLTGDRSLEEIATACGFANRFHFSRVFAALMGEGPAGYRRRLRPAPVTGSRARPGLPG